MTAARVSQVAVEVLRAPANQKARVSQVGIEVLRTSDSGRARVGQLAIEVLRPYLPTIQVTKPPIMAITTTFSVATPDQNPSKELKPRILSSGMGDGYEQRTADGINYMLEVWSLSWTLRTKAVAVAITDFFEGQGGLYAFNWTTPEGKSKVFKCQQWRSVPNHDGDWTVTATFEQVPA